MTKNEGTLETLKNLSTGDKVRIHPDTSNFHTPSFQPEEPFETKVKYIRKKRNRRDSYVDRESGARREFDSREHEIVFQPHPDHEKAEEYFTHYKKFMDGYETIGSVLSRHYFHDNGQRCSAEGGSGFSIEEIKVIDG